MCGHRREGILANPFVITLNDHFGGERMAEREKREEDAAASEEARHASGSGSDEPITELLRQFEDGDDRVGSELFDRVYAQLHKQAAGLMQAQRQNHTLQASALVNEAYMKLVGGSSRQWNDRTHFFAVAARAMRSVLIDHARSKSRKKRSADGQQRVPLEEISLVYEERAVNLLDLDAALDELARRDETAARIVELRFFGGLTVREVAEIVGVTERSAERSWEFARAWLRRRIR